MFVLFLPERAVLLMSERTNYSSRPKGPDFLPAQNWAMSSTRPKGPHYLIARKGHIIFSPKRATLSFRPKGPHYLFARKVHIIFSPERVTLSFFTQMTVYSSPKDPILSRRFTSPLARKGNIKFFQNRFIISGFSCMNSLLPTTLWLPPAL